MSGILRILFFKIFLSVTRHGIMIPLATFLQLPGHVTLGTVVKMPTRTGALFVMYAIICYR